MKRIGVGQCARSAGRRGVILVLSALFMVVALVFVAFTVDVGYISLTKTRLQNTADAAAMAAAWELLDEQRLQQQGQIADRALTEAQRLAGANSYEGVTLGLDPDSDVRFGRMAQDGSFVGGGDPGTANSVFVRVQRTSARNGSLGLFFAPVMGIDQANVSAEAVAMFRDDIRGFQPNERTGPSTLIPFTVQIDDWQEILAGHGSDDWKWNQDTKTITAGADGLCEILIYPKMAAPGTFGALKIGDVGNGPHDLVRQLQQGGLTARDFAPYGGKLELDPVTKSIELPGHPGQPTPVVVAAQEILGQPVSLPVYSEHRGSGNNSVYTIVGFAGARVMYVGLGGNKSIVVQPAVVVDNSTIGGDGNSWEVYQPVKLVR